MRLPRRITALPVDTRPVDVRRVTAVALRRVLGHVVVHVVVLHRGLVQIEVIGNRDGAMVVGGVAISIGSVWRVVGGDGVVGVGSDRLPPRPCRVGVDTTGRWRLGQVQVGVVHAGRRKVWIRAMGMRNAKGIINMYRFVGLCTTKMAGGYLDDGASVANPRVVSLEADEDGGSVPSVGPHGLLLSGATPVVHDVADGVVRLDGVRGVGPTASVERLGDVPGALRLHNGCACNGQKSHALREVGAFAGPRGNGEPGGPGDHAVREAQALAQHPLRRAVA